ncbi:MAG: MBL fold metallo-hydrolase, partial [Acidobacteria bacterium]|nr:MBL fold metallo-hydrolase [Acidobacteriota bacterium]
MKRLPIFLATALLLVAASGFIAQSSPSARRTLDIFYVDVEGGAATLIVTPAGES